MISLNISTKRFTLRRFHAKILSIFIISIALYLRYDWDIRNYIIELGAQLMWTGPYIMIASSSLTILIALLGCSAAIRENPLQLLVVSRFGLNSNSIHKEMRIQFTISGRFPT